ncbi:putative MFS transporter [Pseudomonas aeruginosa]|nr:putative MFS transporter [Pseudomonas aeruginosa]
MQGLILSSFFWAYALLQIPGGWLIDRYGPRRVIGWSTGLWGAFQTLAAFASGGLSLMFARVALGAAEAPLFPSGGKLNSLWLGLQRTQPRRRADGLRRAAGRRSRRTWSSPT